MAGPQAIAAVSRALAVIAAKASVEEDGPFDIAFRHLAEIPSLTWDGVAIVLLRAEPSADRNARPSAEDASGVRSSALLLDLFYLLAPHAAAPERQQRLLGRLFQALAQSPVLDAATLNARQPDPIFVPSESLACAIDSVAEPLPSAILVPPSIRLRVTGLRLTAPADGTGPGVVTRRPIP